MAGRQHLPRHNRWLAVGVVCLLWWVGTSTWAEDPHPTAAPAGGYDAKGKRDPFVPLVRDGRMIAVTGEEPASSGPADVSLPLLGGILWDPAGRSIALLNDKEAMVGDLIGSYRLAEIYQDHIVLEQEGRRVTLRITFDQNPKKEE